MLERIKIQRQLWVKGSFQFFLTIQRWVPCSLCFYVPHLPWQKWWLLLPRTGWGCLRNWEFLCWVQGTPSGQSLGLACLSCDSEEASINKHWQTTCFANPSPGLLLMLPLGILSSAVLSPARTLMGFSPCLTAHLTIYLNGFLASLLSSHAKSTNTC